MEFFGEIISHETKDELGWRDVLRKAEPLPNRAHCDNQYCLSPFVKCLFKFSKLSIAKHRAAIPEALEARPHAVGKLFVVSIFRPISQAKLFNMFSRKRESFGESSVVVFFERQGRAGWFDSIP